MNLSVGIIGFPNAGKSTLFNALLGRQLALVAEHPFTTIEPNIGIVEVPDERLEKLTQLVKPEKTVTVTVRFVDVAGLVKGAHLGEGLGNQFLSQIRSCDLILHLVRAFTSPSVSRIKESTDPLLDVEIVNLEMILADLEIVEKKFQEVEKQVKSNPKLGKLLATLGKIKTVLEREKSTRLADLTAEEESMINDLNLLTLKPVIYILNTDENGPASGQKLPVDYQSLEICALLESELNELEPQERKQTLLEFGINESGLDKLIKEAYRQLGLVTFYTIKGGKEVHAWPIKKRETAIVAAAAVHTDMAKGFIKAEVINFESLVKAGSWQAAKSLGKTRLEGKDYQVNDGDIIEFRFSV